MKFNLSPIQISIMFSYTNKSDKPLDELINQYGGEEIYNECKWLQDNGYLSTNIKFIITLTNNFFSIISGNAPIFTNKGIQALNYYKSLR